MNIQYTTKNLPLSESFTTSRGTRCFSKMIIVQLSDEKHIGFGTCIPEDHKDITAERICLELNRIKGRFSASARDELFRQLAIGTFVQSDLDVCNNTLSGLIMAALDLYSKQHRQVLSELMGNPPTPTFTCKTVTVSDLDAVASVIEPFLLWKGIKIKTGPKLNLAVIDRLRSIYSGTIIVDANGSWDLFTAIENVRLLDEMFIDVIEEPISNAYSELWQHYVPHNSKLFADESCVSMADIERLHPYIDGVVLKQNKSGGLRSVRDQMLFAQSLSLSVMLGCKVESQIGTAACVHLSQPGIICDLDGHTFLREDVFSGLSTNHVTGELKYEKSLGIGIQCLAT